MKTAKYEFIEDVSKQLKTLIEEGYAEASILLEDDDMWRGIYFSGSLEQFEWLYQVLGEYLQHRPMQVRPGMETKFD